MKLVTKVYHFIIIALISALVTGCGLYFQPPEIDVDLPENARLITKEEIVISDGVWALRNSFHIGPFLVDLATTTPAIFEVSDSNAYYQTVCGLNNRSLIASEGKYHTFRVEGIGRLPIRV